MLTLQTPTALYRSPLVLQSPPPSARPAIWRVLHDLELGELWRDNMPEVHPFMDSHFWEFGEAWQRFTFALNPHLTPKKWTAVYGNRRFLTNNNGFYDDGDLRANYILGEDLNRPNPKCEALVCGGAVMAGTVSGSNFIPETLNGRDAPPSVEWLLDHPWLYFHAVTVDSSGTPRMFPQGDGVPILIPLVADRTRYPTITIPVAKLQRWTAVDLPDAYRIYL